MAKENKPTKKPYDIEAICCRIEDGDSQADIARTLGITPGRLSQILSADDETHKRSARARLASAEAWLDKGLAVVESALHKTGDIDASAAKAYAQECARRAALRNPLYRDKMAVDAHIEIKRSAASLTDDELAAIAIESSNLKQPSGE